MTSTNPCDMGALLTAALAASGLTQADVVRETGMLQPNVSRAFSSANTTPLVARRILTVIGHHVEARPDKRVRK